MDEARGTNDDRWEPRDALLGLLLLATGLLVCGCAYLAWREGFTWFIGLSGLAIGPILVLIGGSGLVQSLLVLRRTRASTRPDGGG